MNPSHFSNQTVNLDDLEPLDKSQLSKLPATYYQTNFVIRTVVTLVLLVILLTAKYQSFFPLAPSYDAPIMWGLWVVGCIGSMAIIFGYFADRAIGYHVRELDISLYSGVIFKKIVSQPYLRLQHIELKRGPIERKVGLATIQVFSAGGSAHTFSLPGITVEQAISLRQFILDHKDVAHHE